MAKIFARLKYNKKLLALAIIAIIDVCMVLGICVFDVFEMIVISNNSAKLSKLFLPLNIVLIVLVAVSLLTIVTFFVCRLVKERKNEFKKN